MKRYKMEGAYDEKHDVTAMETEDPNGEFVLYEDVKDLQKENEDVKKLLDQITELEAKATMLDAIAKVGFTPRQLGAIEALKE